VSEENVEIVRRGFEAWDQGDLGAHLRLVHEDVVCRRAGAVALDTHTYHGLEGYLKFASEWFEPYDDLQLRPSQYIDAGDKVVVECPQEGHLVGSDQLMKGTFWFLLTILDAKVIRFEAYGGRGEALEAAGLSE
jgi:ketosteroid isomerase-like protein